MATTQRKSSVRAGINVTIFFLLFISPILGYYVSQKKIRQFFVPERKYAANLAVQMFATGARFR